MTKACPHQLRGHMDYLKVTKIRGLGIKIQFFVLRFEICIRGLELKIRAPFLCFLFFKVFC